MPRPQHAMVSDVETQSVSVAHGSPSPLSLFALATYPPGLIVVCSRSMTCPRRSQEEFLVSSPPNVAKTWQNQGWELASWRRRYDKDHVIASKGVGDRCCGRSMTYPGLEKCWVGFEARPDRRTGTFAGVEVFIVTVPQPWMAMRFLRRRQEFRVGSCAVLARYGKYSNEIQALHLKPGWVLRAGGHNAATRESCLSWRCTVKWEIVICDVTSWVQRVLGVRLLPYVWEQYSTYGFPYQLALLV